MTIRSSKETGSTLLVCLFTAGLIGLSLMAYLNLVATQNIAAARSQSWNAAMPLLEAGIEEAMAHLNADRGNNKGQLATAGWKNDGKGGYVMQRNWGDGYYIVHLSTNHRPVITSTGFIRVPASTNYVSRTVAVTTSNAMGGGIVLRDTVNLNGNYIGIDSFDSTDTRYSTGGIYDPAKRKDNAQVICNGGVKDAVSIGNADIWGTVATGPGGSVYTGPNGTIGNLAWHNARNKGVMPGAVTQDAAVDIPDPPPPPGGAIPPSGGKVGPTTYTYVLGNGVYVINGNLNASTYVGGNATLIVMGKTTLGSSSPIVVGSGGSLKLYCYGDVQMGGGSLVNSTGQAKNFTLYGMTTCKEIKFAGGQGFTGQILAPDTAITGGGGGGTPLNFSGSIQARSLTLTGRFQLHYDESLGSLSDGYFITSWNEL